MSELNRNTGSPVHNIDAIKVLREVLSSMIQNPVYESDPTMVGKKMFVRYEQTPIVEGDKRKLVEDKLLELISEL